MVTIDETLRRLNDLYQTASVSGNLELLAHAESEIDAALPLFRRPDDLYLLKANIAMKLHRLDDAERWVQATPELSATDEARKIGADILFQRGRYAEARAAFERLVETDRSWDNLARYAHFIAKMESIERADQIYAEAEDEITSKQMRSFAWIELQRAGLDADEGRIDEALAHCAIAERAYPGHWMTGERTGKLLAAKGRLDEAAAALEAVLASTRRPETAQSLGSVYQRIGDSDRAQALFDFALSRYLESAGRGEVHYYHHLVDFHCSVTRDGAEAVRWARKDVTLRRNVSTESALAWALFLDGRLAEAAEWIESALASGVIDRRIHARAAEIRRAAPAA